MNLKDTLAHLFGGNSCLGRKAFVAAVTALSLTGAASAASIGVNFVNTGDAGVQNGAARIVMEHITRIDDDCASDWPYPPEGRGCHQVLMRGNPDLTVSVHGHDAVEPGPAGGGNATAANRIVHAIPAVCAAAPGIVSALDLLNR